jgi:hypothetical protein
MKVLEQPVHPYWTQKDKEILEELQVEPLDEKLKR